MSLNLRIFKFFESVGVWIGHYELCLGVYESPCQSANMCALFRYANVGKELICGVSQPHGFDISGDDVC